MTLRISQIDFGSIDAKHELIMLGNDPEFFFTNVFVQPTSNPVEEILKGKIQFILGLKGTGKTALLRFIGHEMRKRGVSTRFFLFKSDLSEAERQRLSISAGFELVEDERNNMGINQDFESIWLIFLARLIVRSFEEETPQVLESKGGGLLQRLLSVLDLRSAGRNMLSLIPDIRNGKLKLTGDIGPLAAEFSGDLNFKKTSTDISIASVCTMIEEALTQLPSDIPPLVVLIDEMELAYGHKDTFDRDCRLLRDLLVVVSRLNISFRTRGIKVRIVSALRSEVLRTVTMLGKEVNKEIEDFGMTLTWHEAPTRNYHPLLFMVEKRIVASEISHKKAPRTKDIWTSYFPNRIIELSPQTFLLHYSWYRPRDIVRLLNNAKARAGNYIHFTQQNFESCLKEYATAAWTEHSEELQAGYSQSEIAAIKQVFLGWRRRFTLDSLVEECQRKARIYPDVGKLVYQHGIETVLNDLYRIGIVGNDYMGTSKLVNRWIFRGDDSLDLTRRMAVHIALWRAFSLVDNA